MVNVKVPPNKVDAFVKAFKTILGTLLSQEMIKRAPSSSSNLRQRIWYRVTPNGIEITMPFYGIYVEYGTPGAKKGQSSSVGGKSVSYGPKTDRKMPLKKEGDSFVLLPELEDWANKKGFKKESMFALAKHIQLYGTEPHPFIRPALFIEFPRLVEIAAIQAAESVNK